MFTNSENRVKNNVVKAATGADRILLSIKESAILKLISIIYNVLNSKTNLNRLDTVTTAFVNLTTPNGFTGFENAINLASNIIQAYGSILSGVDLKITKEFHEEDSISEAEMSERLQVSIDELKQQQASSDAFLKDVICDYVTQSAHNNSPLRGILILILQRRLFLIFEYQCH